MTELTNPKPKKEFKMTKKLYNSLTIQLWRIEQKIDDFDIYQLEQKPRFKLPTMRAVFEFTSIVFFILIIVKIVVDFF